MGRRDMEVRLSAAVYLLDVWTMSAYRRQGIGTAMIRRLMERVPGQHIGLQTDDAEAFHTSLGYRHQPVFMSAIAGEWLANEANHDRSRS
jgi:GNAT superfamily N-acetyltransferase